MPDIHLYNTLTNRIEPLKPVHPGEVRIYTCGPTVYAFAHIGNFRTFMFQDILRRFLHSQGYRVMQVMNVTDVDDRIIKASTAAGVGIREYTEKYIQAFLEDIDALHIQMPEELVRATDHIDDMVALIERLQKKGLTYTERRLDLLPHRQISRDTASSRRSTNAACKPARASMSIEYEKDDARDFALWKAPKPGEHFWETPIGPGRPGWHIECSAMAMKYLGDTLDIHAGGSDLIFPHHENEIAQSEARHRQALCPPLAPCRSLDRRRREDVEIARQFLHAARSHRQRTEAFDDPLSPALGAVSPPAQFHRRRPHASPEFRRAAQQFRRAPQSDAVSGRIECRNGEAHRDGRKLRRFEARDEIAEPLDGIRACVRPS